jgi:hypothetical protein
VGGLITDFSDARTRSCPSGYCSELFVGSAAVILEQSRVALFFPYAAPGMPPVVLGVARIPPGDDAGDPKLLSALDSGPSTATVADGFALRLMQCIDTSGYSAVSFTTDTSSLDLGNCALRFSAQLAESQADPYREPTPLDEAEEDVVTVTAGTVTLPLGGDGARGRALIGMQWEFTVPAGVPAGCSAYLLLDDLRLVP